MGKVNPLAEQICREAEFHESERGPWDTHWEDIGTYCNPRRARGILPSSLTPDVDDYAQLYDSTGIQALNTLVSGLMSLLTPATEKWFSYGPRPEIAERPGVAEWYHVCSDIAIDVLKASNLYSQLSETYLDLGGFGTAALTAVEGKEAPIIFRNHPIGSFGFALDEEGNAVALYRTYRMTLRQMASEFGVESLSEKLREAWAKQEPNVLEGKHEVIHKIARRAEFDPESPFAWDMPVGSWHVEKEAKHVLRESGHQELPFMVPRWQTWGEEKWGWGPGWMALPELRQLNFLQQQLDALVDLQVNPRILWPAGIGGENDLRPAGTTYFDPNRPNAMPQEWLTGGRYDIGVDRVNMRREAVNEAFYVSLFQLFAKLDQKNMTAEEIRQRAGERLLGISPIISRATSELHDKLLRRVFAMLLRGGYFPQPPGGIFIETRNGFMFPDPEMQYNSKLAQALRTVEVDAITQTFSVFGPVAEIMPQVFDNFDFDAAFRDTFRVNGGAANQLVDPRVVLQMREARAQAAAAREQAEQAEMAAKAARNASGADIDTLQQLQQL